MDGGTATWIISAMGIAIGAMAGYIVRLHLKINDLWDARVKALEDQITLLTGDDE